MTQRQASASRLLLRVRLEFDPWHLNFTCIDT